MKRQIGAVALRGRTGNVSPTRRTLLTSFTAPLMALGAPGLAGRALAQSQVRIAVPEGPCRLARTLFRSLSDGNEIRVSRQWNVRFVASGDNLTAGFAIEGEQVSVEVEAPASLARLGEIEERRSTAGMWPIRLTSNGLIVSAGRGMTAADLDEALRVARDLIASRYGEQNAQAMVRSFAAELQRAGASLLGQLPDDLFFPSIGPISLSREVELPDGQVGGLSIFYDAIAVPSRGWLASAERRVVTRLAGTEQTAREYWSMTTR
ncbi:MAG: hypothetical protein AAF697_08860 [Pseudomonadota bacterium]